MEEKDLTLSINCVVDLLINNFPNYTISNNGTVTNISTGNVLRHQITDRGYLAVDLFKDGKKYRKKVHILVAQHFISNPDNLPEVNHKDGNKLNPDYMNLEWSTKSDNIKHAYDTGLRFATPTNERPVIQITPSGKLIPYKSATDASRQTGIIRRNICKVCNGDRNKAGNCGWRYADGQ